MRVGLCNRMAKEWYEDFARSSAALGLEAVPIDIGADDWMEQVDGLDLFVWRPTMGDPSMMAEARAKIPLIESMGVRCYPNALMLWLYDDKIRETFFLRRHGHPMPRTHIFFDQAPAREFVAKAAYPLVAKSHCGASSGGVVLFRSRGEADALLDRVFRKMTLWDKVVMKYHVVPRLAKGDLMVQLGSMYRKAWPRYAYFQEFVESAQDWRVTTLGHDLVSVFVRRNRPDDFRASGSGIWDKVPAADLPVAACDLALEISNRHGFTSMTYDFMQHRGAWVIGEISYTFLHNAIYSDTLFRRGPDGYRPHPSTPIGESLLRSVLEAMPEAAHAR